MTSGRYILTPTITLAGNAYLQYSDGAARLSREYGNRCGLFPAELRLRCAVRGRLGRLDHLAGRRTGLSPLLAPDPAIDAEETEHDWELFVGAELTVPLKDNWAVLAETEYRSYDSNYPTRDFDNFSVSLSVLRSF